MKKLTDQIPIQCALNVAIVNKLLTTAAFRQACVDVPPEYGITPRTVGDAWPFRNMSWYAYMMYCLLVVPKELYKSLPDDDRFYAGLVAKRVMRNFSVKKERCKFEKDPTYHFNSLRNSVSHVNYSLNEHGTLTMWDHPRGKEAREHWHWEVDIKTSCLDEFLGEIADAVVAIYIDIRSGRRSEDGLVT